MRSCSEPALAAIGRMTVAATDLEHLLAWIGADRAGGDAGAVFAQPGEPLVAALGSVHFAPAAHRDELITAVEAAGERLALGQAVLRALWETDRPADPALFDEIADQLRRCRTWLWTVLDECGYPVAA